MVIEPCAVQFWSEIILVISNRTRAVHSFDFEITRMISAQIALHSVQLILFISCYHIDFPVNYRFLDAVVEILILLSTVEVSE